MYWVKSLVPPSRFAEWKILIFKEYIFFLCMVYHAVLGSAVVKSVNGDQVQNQD